MEEKKDNTKTNSEGSNGSSIDLDKDQDERLTHVEEVDERVIRFGDRKFERVMMVAGIAVVVSMFILIFIFYNTIEVRNADEQSLSSQVENSFFGQYLTDKDYQITYRLSDGLHTYDPLENVIIEASSAKGVSSVGSKSSGGYRISPSDSSSIVDGSGREVVTLGDPAVRIDTIMVAPDGNSVIFDTIPANDQARNKYGLRLGAYEYHINDERFETLVSDASPGISDETYDQHFVRILSVSPNGRYVAYTNVSKLKLYDRLSGASVTVVELPSATYEPDTGWSERPSEDTSS